MPKQYDFDSMIAASQEFTNKVSDLSRELELPGVAIGLSLRTMLWALKEVSPKEWEQSGVIFEWGQGLTEKPAMTEGA